MGNGAGMGKAPPIGNPHPRLRFKLCRDGDGDGDGFGGGDGDGKAIPGPAPLPSLLTFHAKFYHTCNILGAILIWRTK